MGPLCKKALLFWAVIVLLVSGMAIPAGATPSLRTIGSSTDTWDHSVAPLDHCLAVPDEQVLMPEREVAIAAAGRLNDASVIALSDQEASSLLGLQRDGAYTTLAEQLLTEAIAAQSDQRSRAYDLRQGSWSLADEHRFIALRDRRDALHERPMIFYLVRALVADVASLQDVSASICDQTLLTDVHSTTVPGPGHSPQRLAMLVLLEAPPERSVARWTYPHRAPEAG